MNCPGDADSRFGAWISILNRAAHIYFARHLAPYSIGPGQQAYLLVIRPGEAVSQFTIAERLSMDKANVARAVHSLERAGYIERSRPPDDKRRWEVRLTERGVRVRTEVERHMSDWVGGIRTGVPEGEWQRFVGTLSTIASRAMLRASAEEG